MYPKQNMARNLLLTSKVSSSSKTYQKYRTTKFPSPEKNSKQVWGANKKRSDDEAKKQRRSKREDGVFAAQSAAPIHDACASNICPAADVGDDELRVRIICHHRYPAPRSIYPAPPPTTPTTTVTTVTTAPNPNPNPLVISLLA